VVYSERSMTNSGNSIDAGGGESVTLYYCCIKLCSTKQDRGYRVEFQCAVTWTQFSRMFLPRKLFSLWIPIHPVLPLEILRSNTRWSSRYYHYVHYVYYKVLSVY
jgi:hypothetical protein